MHATFRSALLALAMMVAPSVRAAELPYAASFDGADGSPWPSPWFNGSVHVTQQDLLGNRGRLNGTASFVARMILPGFSESDVEATVTFEFAEVARQGIGFYVRQNGGTLREYVPFGQGYAMFLKGNWAWPEDLGLWREIGGVETQFQTAYGPIGGGLQNGVRYRLRFRVTQQDSATTRLQAKVWPEADAEPTAWTIDGTDAHPLLQNTAGSFAIDIYNHSGASPIYVDDLAIQRVGSTASVPRPSLEALGLSAPSPHPVRGDATVTLTLPRAARADVTLLDAAGRRVRSLHAGPLPAGSHRLSLTGRDADLPPGVYRLIARTGDAVASRRVVVLR